MSKRKYLRNRGPLPSFASPKPLSSFNTKRSPKRYHYKKSNVNKKRKRETELSHSIILTQRRRSPRRRRRKLNTQIPCPPLIDLSNESNDDDYNSNSNNSNHNVSLDKNNTNRTQTIANHEQGQDEPMDINPQNQQQYVEQISETANNIINNISINIQKFNNDCAEFHHRIKTASSLSSLCQIRSIATESLRRNISNCKDRDTINSFKKSSKEAIDRITEYYDINTNDLDEKCKDHNDKWSKVRDEIKECTDQIKVLQKSRNELSVSSKKIETVIFQYKAEKDIEKRLKTECINKVERTIEEVEKVYHDLLQNTEHSETLKDVIGDKIKDFEKRHREWNVTDVIYWIKMIENGYFDCIGHKTFLDQMTKLNVNGNKLKEMSKLFLEMAGLNDDDQCILSRNISRITKQENVRNICGYCSENIIETVMIPCGHQYYCSQCSEKDDIRNCPICRRKVSQVIKTFLSGFGCNEN